MTIRILLIDDHTLFRSGINALLQRQPDFEVVDEASDGVEGIKRAKQHMPDVILLDLNMPGLSGLETLQLLAQDLPGTAVVMLTVSEEVDELTAALRAGACGYLLKNIAAETLADAIRKAAAGQPVITEQMTAKLVEQMRPPKGLPWERWERRAADALMLMCDAVDVAERIDTPMAAAPPLFVLEVPPTGPVTIAGVPVPDAMVEQWRASASVEPLLVDGDGFPVAVEKRKASLSPKLQRSVLLRDGHCRCGDCDAGSQVQKILAGLTMHEMLPRHGLSGPEPSGRRWRRPRLFYYDSRNEFRVQRVPAWLTSNARVIRPRTRWFDGRKKADAG